MLKIFLIFAVLVGTVFGGDVTKHVTLDNSCVGGKLVQLKITDCDSFPCSIKRGKEYTVDALFVLDKDVVNPVVTCGTIYLGRQYSLPGYGGCETIKNATCPLSAGVVYNTVTSFTVPIYVPPIYYSVWCRFEDDDKKGMFCGSGSGKVV